MLYNLNNTTEHQRVFSIRFPATFDKYYVDEWVVVSKMDGGVLLRRTEKYAVTDTKVRIPGDKFITYRPQTRYHATESRAKMAAKIRLKMIKSHIEILLSSL